MKKTMILTTLIAGILLGTICSGCGESDETKANIKAIAEAQKASKSSITPPCLPPVCFSVPEELREEFPRLFPKELWKSYLHRLSRLSRQPDCFSLPPSHWKRY